MKAERVVVDTNVLISALLTPAGKAGAVMRHLAECKTALLLSSATFMDLATRLGKSKFDRYRTSKQMEAYLDWLADAAEWVRPSITITACHDPDDNRFLDIMITGDADLIISGDRDLVDLHPFEGRSILTPAAFLAAASCG